MQILVLAAVLALLQVALLARPHTRFVLLPSALQLGCPTGPCPVSPAVKRGLDWGLGVTVDSRQRPGVLQIMCST
jgi:hypothetical protein